VGIILFTLILSIGIISLFSSNAFAEEQICVDKVWIENTNGKIACVTPSTADKLVQRGWGTILVDEETPVQLLFVQTANSGSFDGDIITLDDIAARTIYFSDRPHRIVGHFTTLSFTDNWDEGDDSFAVDPPNAALVLLDGESESIVVVELTNPVYDVDANTLRYTIQILDESIIPESFDHVVLYIDSPDMTHLVTDKITDFANSRTPNVYAERLHPGVYFEKDLRSQIPN
jgi:hypothetical protein